MTLKLNTKLGGLFRRRRERTIQQQLTGWFVTPWIILVVVLVVVGVAYLGQAVYTQVVGWSVREMSLPAVTALTSLQKERLLEEDMNTGSAQLMAQQLQTDQALAAMNTAEQSVIGTAPDEIKQPMLQLNADFAQLSQIRERVAAHTISPGEIDDYYNGLFDTATSLFETQARVVPQSDTLQGAVTAAELWRSSDTLAREMALVGTALSTGTLSPEQQQQIAHLSGAWHDELESNVTRAEPQVQDAHRQMVSSPGWQQLVAGENAVIARGAFAHDQQPPVTIGQWRSVSNDVLGQVAGLVHQQADLISEKAVEDGYRALATVGGALVVVAAVMTGAYIASRRRVRRVADTELLTPLANLSAMAHQLSDVVRQVQDGTAADIDTHVVWTHGYGRHEVAQVASALRQFAVHAIDATRNEARARQGARAVFEGMAHRLQLLIRTLMKTLGEAEHVEENPQQLERLYHVDHAATRARRILENLRVLTGQHAPSRYRQPIGLQTLLRMAAQEIEQYTRVEIGHVTKVAVVAEAASDTIHLISELLDNATEFSPPNTKVEVWARPAARGVVIVIDDAGLGMDEDKRAWANALVAAPPRFERLVEEQDRVERLGLFTAAHLASRRGITLEFGRAIAGGARVTLLLPSGMLTELDKPATAVNGATMRGELPAVVPQPSSSSNQPESVTDETNTGQRAQRQVVSEQPTAATAAAAAAGGARSRPQLPRREPGVNLGEIPTSTSEHVVGDPTALSRFFDSDENEKGQQ